MHTKFESDLEFGKGVEKDFTELLIKKNEGCVVRPAPNRKFGGRDIRAVFDVDWLPRVVNFEVKADRQAEETGNIAIEYMYKGRPSGIVTSASDFIVYFFGGQFWVVPREVLLSNMMEYRTVKGGDDNLSSLVLLPVNKVKKIFTLYE